MLSSLSLSDNTVQPRTEEMSEHMKNQVVCVLQSDESTNVSSCAQLMVYTAWPKVWRQGKIYTSYICHLWTKYLVES